MCAGIAVGAVIRSQGDHDPGLLERFQCFVTSLQEIAFVFWLVVVALLAAAGLVLGVAAAVRWLIGGA